MTLEGLVFLLISSQLFPWKTLAKTFPILKRAFQAPFRLNVIAFPLIFLGIALTLTSLLKKKHTINKLYLYSFSILLLIATIMSGKTFNIENKMAVANFNNPKVVVNYPWYSRITPDRMLIKQAVRGTDLGKFHTLIYNVEPDYLPNYKDYSTNKMYRTYVNSIINREPLFKHSVNKNGTLILSWKSNHKIKTELPIILYKQSVLKINGASQKYTLNSIGAPTIKSEVGNITAYLNFNSPNWFFPLCIVSLIAWILVFLLFIINKRKLHYNE